MAHADYGGSTQRDVGHGKNSMNPVLSSFAKKLLKISLQLTDVDVSNIKLVLQVSGHIKERKMSDLKNPADLLRFMWSRGLVSENDSDFLMSLLMHIDRNDLCPILLLRNRPKTEESRLFYRISGASTDTSMDTDHCRLSDSMSISDTQSNASDDDKMTVLTTLPDIRL